MLPERSRLTHITHPEGTIQIDPIDGERVRLTLKPNDPNLYIPRRSCETGFPLELIGEFIARIAFGWLCEAIARHDDPEYVKKILIRHILAYFAPEDLIGKHILDFGCGNGASTFALATAFPQTKITGVELTKDLVDMALQIQACRQLPNVRFLQSPAGDRLPDKVRNIDIVMLSGVYEHLLPSERQVVIPLIWNGMRPEGVLFINQTPHRYYPVESHSTGLPVVNYLPDSLVHFAAQRFARIPSPTNQSDKWQDHLRGGIRGGSEPEIIGIIARSGGKSEIIQPSRNGLCDRADFWLSCTGPGKRGLKSAIAQMFRITDRLLGVVPSVNLDLALRKV